MSYDINNAVFCNRCGVMFNWDVFYNDERDPPEKCPLCGYEGERDDCGRCCNWYGVGNL